MPRKRKVSRAFLSPKSVRSRVRTQFDNLLEMLMLRPEAFHEKLPTAEHRTAFREMIYPDQFYDLFGFFATVMDQYPGTVENAANACVFRREDFLDFIEKHPIKVQFDPPNLSGLPYLEQYRQAARARADWWVKNNLPMTAKEREWIAAEMDGEPGGRGNDHFNLADGAVVDTARVSQVGSVNRRITNKRRELRDATTSEQRADLTTEIQSLKEEASRLAAGARWWERAAKG